jgi:hypothetical protein
VPHDGVREVRNTVAALAEVFEELLVEVRNPKCALPVEVRNPKCAVGSGPVQ